MAECRTRPRYYCLFSTTTKSRKQFLFSRNLHSESVWFATLKWAFLIGSWPPAWSDRITVARRDKTRPKIQDTSQNPKTRPRIQKHIPKSKTPPPLGRVFGFWDMFCPYKPRIDVIWKQTNNNKLECLRIQQWVISSIQYFLVQVITLSLYSHFFQPYFFKFCEFYSGMALYDVYDEVGDFPFKGHICAWMKNET